MLTFIALFFPSVFAVFIFERISKKRLDAHNFFCLFAVNTLAINLVCITVKRFLLGTAFLPLTSGWDMTPGTMLNYLIIALPSAVCIAFLEVVFSHNVSVTVEEIPDEAKK